MPTEELRARLAAAGLGRVADAVVRLAEPSIRFDIRKVQDEAMLPVGCSKLGGTPDLPAGDAWPAWRGSPMAFIGQVSLADIAAHDEAGDLPHAGLLSFFCAVDGTAAGLMQEPDDPASWQVRRLGGDLATLVRVPRPPDLPDRLRFPASPATFRREPTLPDVESRAILDLGLSEPERNAYIDMQWGTDVGYLPAMSHHLLGHPYRLGESPFISAYMKAHGIVHPYYGGDVDPEARQAPREELDRQWQELQHNAEAEWRLLLQVYSNEEAQMHWGPGGVLHFVIPREALSGRDFTRVWVGMQFV